jgi:hypothetical protein
MGSHTFRMTDVEPLPRCCFQAISTTFQDSSLSESPYLELQSPIKRWSAWSPGRRSGTLNFHSTIKRKLRGQTQVSFLSYFRVPSLALFLSSSSTVSRCSFPSSRGMAGMNWEPLPCIRSLVLQMSSYPGVAAPLSRPEANRY